MKKTYEFIIIYQSFQMRDGYKTAVIRQELKDTQDPYQIMQLVLKSPFIKVEGGLIPTKGIYEVQIREAAAV